MMRTPICLVAFLGASVPAAASAQEKPRDAEATPRRAEELAAQAYELHGKGDYAEAIALYLKAYQSAPATPILFNIASIYDRKLHENALASDYYRRYLAAPDADPALVLRASERMAALNKEAAASKDRPAEAARVPPGAQETATPIEDRGKPRAAPPPVTEPSAGAGPSLRVAGLVVGGVGLAGVVVGSALGGLAMSRNNEAAGYCNGVGCTDARALTLTSQARLAATGSTVGFAAGGALLAGGALMFLLAPRSPRPVALWPALQLGPRTAGLAFTGSFR